MNSSTAVILGIDETRAKGLVEWSSDIVEMRIIDGFDQLSPEIDLVILDQQMLKRDGDQEMEICELLAGYRCVILSETRPTPDILGSWIVKWLEYPIEKDKFRDFLQKEITRSRYDEHLLSFYELVTKRAELTEMNHDFLHDDDVWRLHHEIISSRESVDEILASLIELEDFPGVFRSVMIDTS